MKRRLRMGSGGGRILRKFAADKIHLLASFLALAAVIQFPAQAQVRETFYNAQSIHDEF